MAPSLLRILAICSVAVAVLFAAYEIVERVWLADAGPEVLWVLHILRGVAAAAIASAVAVMQLLRVDAPLPGRGGTVLRRLQHVRLRVKVVIPMLLLATLPALGIGLFMISTARESLRASARRLVAFETAAKAGEVEKLLGAVKEDLLFVARMSVLQDLTAAVASRNDDLVRALRERAEAELLIFSQGRRAYYQIRYLDGSGREVVRLNVREGRPWPVPEAELQDKSDRYYTKEALSREPGQVYVSPMDLNVERGEVEIPHRPVVRYAIPVSRGEGRGLVVLNVDAEFIFSALAPLPSGAEAWLLDAAGRYLGYEGAAAEGWRRYSLASARGIADDFSKAEVGSILDQREGLAAIETGGALLSSYRLGEKGGPGSWILVIAYPRAPVEAPIRQLIGFLAVVMAFVLAGSGITGILVAHYLARPVAALRSATREIAAGNLDKRVDIATGDEIEGLADDFNRMTERLREAKERLSGWNEELEREVARQTERMRELQAGLARSDKLASIGQMTAGVMHEIGNPLAAIKTKIQVAEEEGVGREARHVLDEIIAEVDRLAAFLRSFSRLARLRDPNIQSLDPAEVARSVTALISPELSRRGITVRLDADGGLPSIDGDADQLRQLLINLILNAADASGDGAEVLVRLHSVDAGTCIEVADRGQGMSAETLRRMWDPFFTTKEEGTGLGLAICRRIADDHGAAIDARSARGEGTVVSARFPGGKSAR